MKKQLKQDLQKLFNQIQKCDEESSMILKELQDMSSDLGLPRWCSWQNCAEQLEDRKEKYTKHNCNCTYGARARLLLKNFYKSEGKRELLTELGQALADNGFWK